MEKRGSSPPIIRSNQIDGARRERRLGYDGYVSKGFKLNVHRSFRTRNLEPHVDPKAPGEKGILKGTRRERMASTTVALVIQSA
jgi:hypothetical protein